jgi:hypothetical protein
VAYRDNGRSGIAAEDAETETRIVCQRESEEVERITLTCHGGRYGRITFGSRFAGLVCGDGGARMVGGCMVEPTERFREWKMHWRLFLDLYPEARDLPMKLDKDWLAGLMAEKSEVWESERIEELEAEVTASRCPVIDYSNDERCCLSVGHEGGCKWSGGD